MFELNAILGSGGPLAALIFDRIGNVCVGIWRSFVIRLS